MNRFKTRTKQIKLLNDREKKRVTDIRWKKEQEDNRQKDRQKETKKVNGYEDMFINGLRKIQEFRNSDRKVERQTVY